MLKPRRNHCSGWGKGLLDQKSMDESFEDQVMFAVFFDWEALSTMNFYHLVKW
jgi:hypothetical protein